MPEDYNPDNANVREAFGGLVTSMAQVGAGIVGTTKSYEEIDRENRQPSGELEQERSR